FGKKDIADRLEEKRPRPKLTPEQEQKEKELVDRLTQKAEDLNSPDPQKREAAEKEFDEAIGQKNREKLQDRFRHRLAGDKDVELKPALEADPRHRLRSAELQLEQFKKHQDDPELLKKLGWTEEQYKEFVKEYEKAVANLKEDVARGDVPELRP